MSVRTNSTVIAKMRELRAGGMIYRDIADRFSVNLSTAYTHTKDVATPPKPKITVKKKDLSNKRLKKPRATPDVTIKAEPTTITDAPQNWQRRWFATPQHRRDRIEEHLEHCQLALARLNKLDTRNRDQYPMWNTIIKNSPWSNRHCGRLTLMQPNTINQYLTGNRIPKGTRNQLALQALMWNITADSYHHHLEEMMWATYWAERNEDAPGTISTDEGFTEWANRLNEHPLYQDLPHGIAHDPAINIYAESSAA